MCPAPSILWRTAPGIFSDNSRAALRQIVEVAAGRPNLAQDELVRLLAGPDVTEPEAQQVRAELANRIQAVLQNQRLVSLDTLFALSDGLRPLAQGANPSAAGFCPEAILWNPRLECRSVLPGVAVRVPRPVSPDAARGRRYNARRGRSRSGEPRVAPPYRTGERGTFFHRRG